MNTPTPDPLPLSIDHLEGAKIALLDWPENTPLQILKKQQVGELITQSEIAIKLKEENDALRKAGEEMFLLLKASRIESGATPAMYEIRHSTTMACEQWRKVAGGVE